MYFKALIVTMILALPTAGAAQQKGGQGKTGTALPVCGVLPDGSNRYDCTCPAGFSFGDVWGSGPYTADSDICTAALHTGLIGGNGGAVTVTRVPGEPSYVATTSNGVTTRAWEEYDTSILLTPRGVALDIPHVGDCAGLPAGQDAFHCTCPFDPGLGSVWGSGPFTSDSDICTAAIHAGVIDKSGGDVRVHRKPGQPGYAGGTRNGVTTYDYGSYGESYILGAPFSARSDGSKVALVDIGPCGDLPEGAIPVICSCDAPSPTAAVWGSGPYTGDSNICTAALHAGVIGPRGGRLTLARLPGQDSYAASEAFGVRTLAFGRYGSSFAVALAGEIPVTPARGNAPAGAGPTEIDAGSTLPACSTLPDGIDSHRCSCDAGIPAGQVWGAGPYTADSDICTAAHHAGIIRIRGGEVTVLRVQGLPRYAGTSDNGIRTESYEQDYDSSIVFDRNQAP